MLYNGHPFITNRLLKPRFGILCKNLSLLSGHLLIVDTCYTVYYNSTFNPFLANLPILYPLKTLENQRFSGVFRGYKMETLARNRLIYLSSDY